MSRMYQQGLGGGFGSLISEDSLTTSSSSLVASPGSELPEVDLGETWSFSYMVRSGPSSRRPTSEQASHVGTPTTPTTATTPTGSSVSSTNPLLANNNYDQLIHTIATCSTTNEFWAIHSHLRRPAVLPHNSDLHVFRRGVRPLWEDTANARGGKWMVRLRKGLAGRLWEHLLMALIGDEFKAGDEVCGIVLSIRSHEDILSVWNQSAEDEQAKAHVKEVMKKVLMLPPQSTLEYKAHDQSLKDNSSFRNTNKAK